MTALQVITNLKRDFPDYYISLEIRFHYYGISKNKRIIKMYNIAIRLANGKAVSTNQKVLAEADKTIRDIMKCQ